MSSINIFDPISPKGHCDFNTRLIEGFDTSVNFSLIDNRAYNYKIKTTKISKRLFKKDNLLFLFLRHFYSFLNFSDNLRIVLSFENRFIFILLFPFINKRKIILLIHNNIPGYLKKSKFTRCIFDLSIRKTNIIFFSPSPFSVLTHIRFNSHLISCVPFSSHVKFDCSEKISNVIWIARNNDDMLLFKSLCKSQRFFHFLTKNNLRFYSRKSNTYNSLINVVKIPQFLDSTEYNKLFSSENIIILSYDKSYRFKASAILVHCVSSSANLLISDMPENREFSDLLSYNNYFSDLDDLLNKLDVLLKSPDIDRTSRVSVLEKKRIQNLNMFLSLLLDEKN